MNMHTPEWLKPGLYGAAIGAAALAVVGFSWGGWVTGGSADKMATAQAQAATVAALMPICVAQSQADSERVAKIAVIREAPSYKRRDAVMSAGWATVPGSDAPNRDVAQACVDGLALDAS